MSMDYKDLRPLSEYYARFTTRAMKGDVATLTIDDQLYYTKTYESGPKGETLSFPDYHQGEKMVFEVVCVMAL